MAPAAAMRARALVVAAGSVSAACPWPTTAKPATQKFVDAIDHRRRRLSEPSP